LEVREAPECSTTDRVDPEDLAVAPVEVAAGTTTTKAARTSADDSKQQSKMEEKKTA
jgi:hypothetical protein